MGNNTVASPRLLSLLVIFPSGFFPGFFLGASTGDFKGLRRLLESLRSPSPSFHPSPCLSEAYDLDGRDCSNPPGFLFSVDPPRLCSYDCVVGRHVFDSAPTLLPPVFELPPIPVRFCTRRLPLSSIPGLTQMTRAEDFPPLFYFSFVFPRCCLTLLREGF